MTTIKISDVPSHTHGGGTFSQSMNMRVYNSNIIIALDKNSKVNVLKNRWRWSHHVDDLSLHEVIDILTEILTRNLFNNSLDMFREGLKIELIKSINKTIKEGVANADAI